MLQEIQSLRSLLAQKDTELQKKSQILEMYAQKLPEQQAVIEKQASQRRQYVQALHRYLIQLE